MVCGGADGKWWQITDVAVERLASECKGAALKGKESVYGSGSGRIILDNVVCTGREDNLLLCSHNDLFETNCDHSEDAAVVCNGN